MPEGMLLRSPGFGSDLSDPAGAYTLEQYWRSTGRDPQKLREPIPLDTFVAYSQWFIDGVGVPVEDVYVERLTRASDGFTLTLATGEVISAARVVLAIGLTHFAYVPPELDALSGSVMSHASKVTRPSELAGRDVAIVGAGQSALETAALLHEAGAHVTVFARCNELQWTGDAVPANRSLLERLRRPDGRLCDGWGCIGFEYGPMLIHQLPEKKRLDLIANNFGPMGAWWLRERLRDIPILLGRTLASASEHDGRAELKLQSADGIETVSADHVVAATGYRVDLERLTFLDPSIRGAIRRNGGCPALTRGFESSVPGLHFVGAASMASFGPVTRFVCGTTFTSRKLSRYLDRHRSGQRRQPAGPTGDEHDGSDDERLTA
jgi:thioredoxin reductase